MRLVFAFLCVMIYCNVSAQVDTIVAKKLKFTSDFRFRIEHDWNGQRTDGSRPDDRSRLRYRFRFGLNYAFDQKSTFGARLRSGRLDDQQGPHVTLGGNNGEFGLVEIGLEKLFYQYKSNNVKAWVGKNTLPLKKLNELFWNDNVFPEGVAVTYAAYSNEESLLNKLSFNACHLIIQSTGQTFNRDRFAQFYQLDFAFFNNRLSFFPAFYMFRNLGNIPDGQETFELDYSILHLGTDFKLSKKPEFSLGLELYTNLEDYSDHQFIFSPFQDQTQGSVISAKLGTLKKKGDWHLHVYYAHLQRFSIVDYFAQNDWVRWDYSGLGAAGSRITNFQGFEFQIGYLIKENFDLILRAYTVTSLVRLENEFRERGQRVRLDLNIKF